MATRKKTAKTTAATKAAPREPRLPLGLRKADVMKLWEASANKGDSKIVRACQRTLEGSTVNAELVQKALERRARY